MTDMTLNGLGGLEAAWSIIANAYGGDWESAPDDWRAAAERWRDEVWHPALDASRVSPHPLRFDNATTVREIAYRCAGAGSGAVMRLAGDVVMPAAEIGEAVEEILCDFWPEAAGRAAATPRCDACDEPFDGQCAACRAEDDARHPQDEFDGAGCCPEEDGYLRAKAETTGECRAPHCWSEYGTPCGSCPRSPDPETDT